jgi:hypothetical protein
VRGLLVRAEYYTQTTASGDPVMVMARMKPIAIIYLMLPNPFSRNLVKLTEANSWWYE